jgi:hypothetical protein
MSDLKHFPPTNDEEARVIEELDAQLTDYVHESLPSGTPPLIDADELAWMYLSIWRQTEGREQPIYFLGEDLTQRKTQALAKPSLHFQLRRTAFLMSVYSLAISRYRSIVLPGVLLLRSPLDSERTN